MHSAINGQSRKKGPAEHTDTSREAWGLSVPHSTCKRSQFEHSEVREEGQSADTLLSQWALHVNFQVQGETKAI